VTPMNPTTTDRFAAFERMKDHPLFNQDMKKLSVKDRVFCRDFILANVKKTDDEFLIAVNRIGLDVDPKPVSNLSIVWGLLSQTVAPRVRKRRRYE
jgi:hypothetical protein